MSNYNEDSILSLDFRAKKIKEFKSRSNKERKDNAYKAYQCLKDKTFLYVIDLLRRQFDKETVDEMAYALTNISILKKVISKLAKVYSNGVKREIPDDKEGTIAIEDAAKYLKLDMQMKKSNKYFRTFKNSLLYPKPVPCEDKYDLKVDVIAPYNYDAISEPGNPEEAMVIILSDYDPNSLYVHGTPDRETELTAKGGQTAHYNIDSPGSNDDCQQYIWWSKNYHFTTDAKGNIISDSSANHANPILELPFVNIADEQDGKFFAEGGQDLIDMGIKINSQITNMLHIGISQGFGQLYMTGKDLPKTVKVGPNHCVQLKQSEGEPNPTIGYLNANPQLAELRNNVEMMMSLMLITNNLSTSGFSMSLTNQSKDYASGIALIIDKSESIEDIGEQSKVYVDAEPEVWDILSKWYKVYDSANLLSDEAKEFPIPENAGDMHASFPSAKQVISESDQLDNLKKRKDQSLNTQAELIQMDRPGLTLEEAQLIADNIANDNMARMQTAVDNATAGGLSNTAAPGASINAPANTNSADANLQPKPANNAATKQDNNQPAQGG